MAFPHVAVETLTTSMWWYQWVQDGKVNSCVAWCTVKMDCWNVYSKFSYSIQITTKFFNFSTCISEIRTGKAKPRKVTSSTKSTRPNSGYISPRDGHTLPIGGGKLFRSLPPKLPRSSIGWWDWCSKLRNNPTPHRHNHTHTPIHSVTWQPKSLWQTVVWLFPAGSSSVSGLVVPATLVATRICSGLKWAWVCVWGAVMSNLFKKITQNFDKKSLRLSFCWKENSLQSGGFALQITNF